MLLSLWIVNKNNLGFLLRLGTECWYVLTSWDFIDNADLDYNVFRHTLIETTEYGLIKFCNEVSFLWIYGYMITLFPELFYENGNHDSEYISWEQKGKEMLKKSQELDPMDPIIEMINIGASLNRRGFRKSNQNVKPILEDRFPFNTAIEEYFMDVFSIEI